MYFNYIIVSILEKGTATTTTSLVAYIGEDVPEYILDETIDAFICKKNKQEVDWLQFLFELISMKSTVLIIYDIKGIASYIVTNL